MSRAGLAASLDAQAKLKGIAAQTLGGTPEDFVIQDQRVFQKDNDQRGLSFAEAARRAIALGGMYDGHECPTDVNTLTVITSYSIHYTKLYEGENVPGHGNQSLPGQGCNGSLC